MLREAHPQRVQGVGGRPRRGAGGDERQRRIPAEHAGELGCGRPLHAARARDRDTRTRARRARGGHVDECAHAGIEAVAGEPLELGGLLRGGRAHLDLGIGARQRGPRERRSAHELAARRDRLAMHPACTCRGFVAQRADRAQHRQRHHEAGHQPRGEPGRRDVDRRRRPRARRVDARVRRRGLAVCDRCRGSGRHRGHHVGERDRSRPDVRIRAPAHHHRGEHHREGESEPHESHPTPLTSRAACGSRGLWVAQHNFAISSSVHVRSLSPLDQVGHARGGCFA